MQVERDETKDQGNDEEQLFESYCKYMDQKFYNIIEQPSHWLEYLHNEWRTLELMEEGCANILDAIQNNSELWQRRLVVQQNSST